MATLLDGPLVCLTPIMLRPFSTLPQSARRPSIPPFPSDLPPFCPFRLLIMSTQFLPTPSLDSISPAYHPVLYSLPELARQGRLPGELQAHSDWISQLTSEVSLVSTSFINGHLGVTVFSPDCLCLTVV